jgi:hypothetical protein
MLRRAVPLSTPRRVLSPAGTVRAALESGHSGAILSACQVLHQGVKLRPQQGVSAVFAFLSRLPLEPPAAASTTVGAAPSFARTSSEAPWSSSPSMGEGEGDDELEEVGALELHDEMVHEDKPQGTTPTTTPQDFAAAPSPTTGDEAIHSHQARQATDFWGTSSIASAAVLRLATQCGFGEHESLAVARAASTVAAGRNHDDDFSTASAKSSDVSQDVVQTRIVLASLALKLRLAGRAGRQTLTETERSAVRHECLAALRTLDNLLVSRHDASSEQNTSSEARIRTLKPAAALAGQLRAHFPTDGEIAALLPPILRRLCDGIPTAHSGSCRALTWRAAAEAASFEPRGPDAIALFSQAVRTADLGGVELTAVVSVARCVRSFATVWMGQPAEGQEGMPATSEAVATTEEHWDLIADACVALLRTFERTLVGSTRSWDTEDNPEGSTGSVAPAHLVGMTAQARTNVHVALRHAAVSLEVLRRCFVRSQCRMSADTFSDVEQELDAIVARCEASLRLLVTISTGRYATDDDRAGAVKALELSRMTSSEAALCSAARVAIERSHLPVPVAPNTARAHSQVQHLLTLLNHIGRAPNLSLQDGLQPSLVALLRRTFSPTAIDHFLSFSELRAHAADVSDSSLAHTVAHRLNHVLGSLGVLLATVPTSAGVPAHGLAALLRQTADAFKKHYGRTTTRSDTQRALLHAGIKMISLACQARIGGGPAQAAPTDVADPGVTLSLATLCSMVAEAIASSPADIVRSLPLRFLPLIIGSAPNEELRAACVATLTGHIPHLSAFDTATVMRATNTAMASCASDPALSGVRQAVHARAALLLSQPTWTLAHLVLSEACTAGSWRFEPVSAAGSQAAASSSDSVLQPSTSWLLPRGAVKSLLSCASFAGYSRAVTSLTAHTALRPALAHIVVTQHFKADLWPRLAACSGHVGQGLAFLESLAALSNCKGDDDETLPFSPGVKPQQPQPVAFNAAVDAVLPVVLRSTSSRAANLARLRGCVESPLLSRNRQAALVLAAVAAHAVVRVSDVEEGVLLVDAFAARVPRQASHVALTLLSAVRRLWPHQRRFDGWKPAWIVALALACTRGTLLAGGNVGRTVATHTDAGDHAEPHGADLHPDDDGDALGLAAFLDRPSDIHRVQALVAAAALAVRLCDGGTCARVLQSVPVPTEVARDVDGCLSADAIHGTVVRHMRTFSTQQSITLDHSDPGAHAVQEGPEEESADALWESPAADRGTSKRAPPPQRKQLEALWCAAYERLLAVDPAELPAASVLRLIEPGNELSGGAVRQKLFATVAALSAASVIDQCQGPLVAASASTTGLLLRCWPVIRDLAEPHALERLRERLEAAARRDNVDHTGDHDDEAPRLQVGLDWRLLLLCRAAAEGPDRGALVRQAMAQAAATDAAVEAIARYVENVLRYAPPKRTSEQLPQAAIINASEFEVVWRVFVNVADSVPLDIALRVLVEAARVLESNTSSGAAAEHRSGVTSAELGAVMRAMQPQALSRLAAEIAAFVQAVSSFHAFSHLLELRPAVLISFAARVHMHIVTHAPQWQQLAANRCDVCSAAFALLRRAGCASSDSDRVLRACVDASVTGCVPPSFYADGSMVLEPIEMGVVQSPTELLPRPPADTFLGGSRCAAWLDSGAASPEAVADALRSAGTPSVCSALMDSTTPQSLKEALLQLC